MAVVGILRVLLLNVLCSFVSSLYFHIGETERKCFIKEIADETMISGDYQTQLFDQQGDEYLPANRDLRMFVMVKDPDDELVLSRLHGLKGSFRFRAQKPGGHQICLQCSSSNLLKPPSAGGSLVVHLDIRVDEHTNKRKISAKDKQTELQLRVQQLTEKVKQIQEEQDYQKLQRERFLELDHSTNMWIFWWPVARSLYVVAIIIWHDQLLAKSHIHPLQ